MKTKVNIHSIKVATAVLLLIGLAALSTIGIAGISSKIISASPSYPSFGVNLPSDFEVHGIDVSRHQRKIDWTAVSKMSHNDVSMKFAFIKASEGRTIADDYFKENWKAAKASGLMRGAYHFYRTHLSADEQASLFFRQLSKLETGDLPPVLDIEIKGGANPATMRKGLKRWLTLVENKYGVKPIIYTNYSFYKNYLNTPEFKKYPLWIAHYKTSNLHEKMSGWHFWQHSDKGYVNGISGTVDFNVFHGKEDQLKELCKK
jgi:lysozyme